MTDPMEYYYEEAMDAFIDEALEQFVGDRLAAYYIENPELLIPAQKFFHESEAMLEHSNTASFIFAAVAIEVCLKEVFLKPWMAGLIHDESLATVVSDLMIKAMSYEQQKTLILKIFDEYKILDLRSHARDGETKPILQEIAEIQSKRNKIIHRAELASKEEATISIAVAREVIEQILPKVFGFLGVTIQFI